jgi:hypothetical protein
MMVPLYAILTCALYEDKVLRQKLHSELDTFEGLTALSLKADDLKSIELKLKAEKDEMTLKEKDKLMETQKDIMRMTTAEVLEKKQKVLYALGRAIFVCNGFSVAGFQDLSEKELRAELGKYLSEDEIKSVFRLSTFEQIYIDKGDHLESYFRFYHRSQRELMVSHYLSSNEKPLEREKNQERLRDSVLSVLQCTTSLLQSMDASPKHLKTSLSFLLDHIFKSCTEADRWRLTQIVANLLRPLVKSTKYDDSMKDLISETTRNIKSFSKKLGQLLNKKLNSHFLDCLQAHAKLSDCQDCVPPQTLTTKAKKLFDMKTSAASPLNWPEKKPLVVHPLFADLPENLFLCFPRSSLFKKMNHTTVESQTCCLKSPIMLQHGMSGCLFKS